jgi:ESS family glutamate:Na+ symporter
MLELDLVQTVAFAGLVLFAGYGLRRAVPPLARNNIPAPVIGGLLAAVVILVARRGGAGVVQFDTTLQAPLMIAFFTTIGLGASVALLRRGGPQVILVLGLATVVAALQNALGMALAAPLGVHPLIGVLAGSVTLAGGPATGLAFAPDFESVGVPAAATVAVASAMVGIIVAGLVGPPIATWLIERHRLAPAKPAEHAKPDVAAAAPSAAETTDAPPAGVETRATETEDAPRAKEAEGFTLLKTVVVILACMWVGGW